MTQLTVVCGLLAVGLACSPATGPEPAAVPALPQLDPADFDSGVREQGAAAYAEVRANPTDAGANGRAGMVFHAYGQLDTAEVFYKRAFAFEPGTLRWPYYLGMVHELQGRTLDGIASLRTASEADPEFAPLRRRLAGLLADEGELESAAGLYRKLLEEKPTDAAAHYGLGRVLALKGDSAAAIASLRKALDLSPTYGVAHYELALAYRDAGDEGSSEAHMRRYEQDKQIAPPADDPLMAAVEALRGDATAYLNRARELESRGDLEGAVASLKQAIEQHPELAQAHINLLILYGRMGEPELARKHYQLASELEPGNASLHYNFGVFAFGQRDVDEAERAFEKAVESNPNHAQALHNLGQLMEARGRVDEAVARYRQALAARPNYRLARFHLGRMLLAKRRPAEAIAEFEKAVEPRDELSPDVLFGIAASRAQLGEISEAKRVGEEARALAAALGQTEAAARIAEDLARLK